MILDYLGWGEYSNAVIRIHVRERQGRQVRKGDVMVEAEREQKTLLYCWP